MTDVTTGATPARSRLGRRWKLLIPAILTVYVIAYIDRVNISFGLSHISDELGLDGGQAGLAAGIFFLSYIVLQVPGGYLAQRWSAKKVVIILMVLWGIAATACGFVQSFEQLLLLRLLLGLFEGGVQPAIMVLIHEWFPEKERGRAFSLFIMHNPIALLIAAPISGLILSVGGWRELFVIQGLLPIVVGLLVWGLIAADTPAKAKWLSETERLEIASLHAEDRKGAVTPRSDWRVAVASPVVWTLAITCFFIWLGFYGLQLWLPSLLQQSFEGELTIGIMTAIPAIVAAAAIWLNGRGGDKDGRYALRVAAPLALGFVVLCVSTLIRPDQGLLIVAAMAVATACQLSFFGPFWAFASKFVPAAGVGIGFGIINGIGNLGGLFGPYLGGWLSDVTGSLTFSSILFGLSVLIAAILITVLAAALRRRAARSTITDPSSTDQTPTHQTSGMTTTGDDR